MRLAILGACVTLGACGDHETKAPSPLPAPRQYVVVVDVSGSRTDVERAGNEQLVTSFARTLGFGDRLVVLPTHQAGRRDGAAGFVLDMPLPTFAGQPLDTDSAMLGEAVEIAAPRLTEVVDREPAAGTDLFATLFTAAERVREAPERNTGIIILSDMLQCTSAVCMERTGGIPDSAWISSQVRQGLIPELEGACVVVVGADASTPDGIAVRQFWTAYFAAAGADLRSDRYFYTVQEPRALRCS